MLRIKQKSSETFTPEAAVHMTEDPPLQPPGRQLEEIPLFMRKPMPMDYPDNSHLPNPEDAIPEVIPGTAVEVALRFKNEGNEHFKAKRWWDAREAYVDAIEFWPDDAKLMEVLWLNLAAANIELEYWPGVLHDAAEALTLNLKSIKGYYRAARALIQYERYEEAVDCCKRALVFEPRNEAIISLFDDPKRGGISLTEGKTKQICEALKKAYQYFGLVIILSNPTNTDPELFPCFSPALPDDPLNAPLFCNVTFKYLERHSMDVLVGVKTDRSISALLKRCLPGNPHLAGWNYGISFDPSLKGKKQIKQLKKRLAQQDKAKHPIWDPNVDYLPSNVSLYVETYRRQAVEIPAKGTLAGTFRQVLQSSSNEQDGVCLEEGSILVHVFRRGSKVEKLWKGGKGRKGFVLAQQQYRKSSQEELLAAGQYRTFFIDAPQDYLTDQSIEARAEMIKSADVRSGREE